MKKSNLSEVVLFVFFISIIFIGFTEGWCEDKQKETPQQTTWKLPDTAQLGRLSLNVSPDNLWFCFFRNRLEGEKPGLFAGVGNYVMLNTKTGAETRVKDFFKEGSISGLGSSTGELQFSSSSKLVLVHASPNMKAVMKGETCSLYLVNLVSKTVSKLAGDSFLMGRWMGESVVITSMGMEKINPVRIVDIKKDSTRELSVCGIVYACDPLGRFIIIDGDPKELGKPVNPKELAGKSHLLAVSLDGGIIKDFGPTNGASFENAMLSRKGKYLIYNRPGHNRPGPSGEAEIRVVSVYSEHDRTIKCNAIPVFVSDNGDAILAEGGLRRAIIAVAEGNKNRGIEYVVSRWSADGNTTRVLADKSIIHVHAQGNRLYYVTATQNRIGEVSFINIDTLFNKENTL